VFPPDAVDVDPVSVDLLCPELPHGSVSVDLLCPALPRGSVSVDLLCPALPHGPVDVDPFVSVELNYLVACGSH